MKVWRFLIKLTQATCVFLCLSSVMDMVVDAFNKYGALSIIPYVYGILFVIVSITWIYSISDF